MSLEKWCRQKIRAARVPAAGYEGHVGCHLAVRHLALDGAARIIGRIVEHLGPARGRFGVAAKRAFVGLISLGIGVVMVGLELLGEPNVDPALVLLHQLIPADVARVRRGLAVIGIKSGLLTGKLLITCEIRSDEVTILGASHSMIPEAEFKLGDLSGFTIAEQPVVGVTTVVAAEHDPDVIVDR